MRNLKKYFKYYFLGALFCGAVFAWYAVAAESRTGLEVDFLDVGQGDAIFIQAPNGNQVLLDGGPPNRAVLRQLSKVMPFYDRSIDALILSHPHLDHYGGLIDLMGKYKINLEMDSGNYSKLKNDSATAKDNLFSLSGLNEYQQAIKTNNIKHLLAKRGMRINLDRDLFVDILLPVINNNLSLSPHDGMVVARLVYKNNSFLLTGDMENNLENFLLSLGENVKSNVLKVGHHGSRTSTSERFLGLVEPEYGVISVGRKNKYGHPHQEVTERLGRFKIPILRTDERGTIRIRSDGEKIFILE